MILKTFSIDDWTNLIVQTVRIADVTTIKTKLLEVIGNQISILDKYSFALIP